MNELGILQYADYRAFLVAHAQALRTRKSRLSYGAWAKRLGMKDTSSLTKILQGKREPGPQITERFVRYFKFSEPEARHFRDLVTLAKVRDDSRFSSILLERLRRTHSLKDDSRKLELDSFAIISNWYHCAIREMVRLDSFLEDPAWIAGQLRFAVELKDVKPAIEALLRVGLLVRDENQKLAIAHGRVNSETDIASAGLRRFHEQMLDNARQALHEVDPSQRQFMGLTLPIRMASVARGKQLIVELMDRFENVMEEPGADAVYQLQMQFFPLTKTQPPADSEPGTSS